MSKATKVHVDGLKAALQADYAFAWTWHCAVACCALDEGVEHAKANKIAERFMRMAFDVDTSHGDIPLRNTPPAPWPHERRARRQ